MPRDVLSKRQLPIVTLTNTGGYSLPAEEREKNRWMMELSSLKMKEGGDLNRHEEDFDRIIEKLTTLKVKKREGEKIRIFLESLPESFVDAVKIVNRAEALTLAEAQKELKRHQVKQNFDGLKMRESKGLTKHLNDFYRIIDELEKWRVEMREEHITLMFLKSLPNSFADMVESVINAERMLTLNNVLRKARTEWDGIKERREKIEEKLQTRMGRVDG